MTEFNRNNCFKKMEILRNFLSVEFKMSDYKTGFDCFRWYIWYWKITGIVTIKPSSTMKKILYNIYRLTFVIGIFFLFPFHLWVYMSHLRKLSEIIENTVMVTAVPLAMCKGFLLFWKYGDFLRLQKISIRLEESLSKEPTFREVMDQFFKTTRKNNVLCSISYTSSAIASVFMAFIVPGRVLPFAGSFPFSTDGLFVYLACSFYQVLCWTVFLYANYSWNNYPGILMFMLKQYLKILMNKISDIGFNESLSKSENNKILREAVFDHRMILEYFETLDKMIKPTSFAQFLVTTLNFVTCMISAMFFTDNVWAKVYWFCTMSCIYVEIILICFYGTEFKFLYSQFTTSLYSCKWYEQDRAFKLNLMIFMERSLRPYEFIAGGIIPTNMDTFVKIARNSFSMYAMLNTMREG